jgi:uncharacterized membrane protein
MMNKLQAAGSLIMVVGIALVALGIAGEGGGPAGGFILIGPFPIVFGTGSNEGELALLSVLVGVLMKVILFVQPLISGP